MIQITDMTGVFNKDEQARVRTAIVQSEIDNERYLRAHPELTDVLSECIREAVLRRPKDPVRFTYDFFASRELHDLHKEILERRQANESVF